MATGSASQVRENHQLEGATTPRVADSNNGPRDAANERLNHAGSEPRSSKTLALWVGWAMVCLFILNKLYNQAHLNNFIARDHTMVTSIIIGVFLFALVISFLHAMQLTREWHRAFSLERMIAEHGLAGLKTLRKPRQDVERFVLSIQAILQRDGHLDLESLVMVEFSSQHRRSQFVGLIGNMLITLGLIGTVLGMTIILGGLNGAMTALGKDQEMLMASLADAMSGMGVAFYTTLMGAVLGGILLRVFSWITDTSVHELQDFMLRTCLVFGAAEVNPGMTRQLHVVDADLSRVQERVKLVARACEASGQEVGKLVGKMHDLHAVSQMLADDKNMYQVAVHHANYWRRVKLSRLFGRFLGAFNSDKSGNN